ncbi:MAG: hypothetical protein ACREAA_11040 [Candidatus Polarisedimenticolia bacterium]
MSSPSAAARTSSTTARWHTHRLNTPLSWRLIFGITPSLPRFAVRALGYAVSALCFLVMARERGAVLRNLERVTGVTGPALWWRAYRVFVSFSRFMVAYASLRRFGPAWLWDQLDGEKDARAVVHRALEKGHGAILLTMHIGQWDMGLSLLGHLGVPVHVVMRPDEPLEVSRLASEARGHPGLRVHHVGASPLLGVELMAALVRGEIVAVQGDRAAGADVHPTPLFGLPAPLPTGPVRLALATGAPIVPVFTLLAPGDRFRLIALPPLELPRQRGEGLDAALREAMPRLAGIMESVIASHSDQWFNFYDVWPRDDAEPTEESE